MPRATEGTLARRGGDNLLLLQTDQVGQDDGDVLDLL